mmetsp:Transcript_86773/g.173203  ORF Transcript_86773/g.173203 Transcript_86773/m.173203 type:complete len:155 (-) Transcript_86773:169-633(-)
MTLALVLLASTAALRGPLMRWPLSMAHAPRRAAAACTIEGVDADPNMATDGSAWPEPAKTVAELQEQEAKAKEAAEAEAMASPSPFILEGGGFSYVALTTVLVFAAGGILFFEGITGSGVARFADDQPPEVQACIKQATTRSEASKCLPPVPLN